MNWHQEEVTFEKQADIPAIANPTAAYNATDGILVITFANGTVPANLDEIKVLSNGNEVSGTMRQNDNIITFIPDVPFTSGASYKLSISDKLRNDTDNYLAAKFRSVFTVAAGGNGSGSGSGSSGGGGGSSSSSVKKPTASTAGGIVEKGTKITLSTTDKNAKIYYTTDGTEPTEKSTLYEGPITIDKDMTIKFIAIGTSGKSDVVTYNYVVKTNSAKSSFSDITDYAWAKNAIEALAEKGIIKRNFGK